MANHIPSVRPKLPTYKNPWLELLFVGGPVVAAIAAICFDATAFVEGISWHSQKGVWLIVALILVAISAFVRVWVANHKEKESLANKSPEGVEAASYCLQSILFAAISQFADVEVKPDCVRVALYRVVLDTAGQEPLEVEQISDYSGGTPYGLGRTFPASKGIVGQCARLSETQLYELAEEVEPGGEEFEKIMMKDFGFTDAEAKGLRSDRVAWLAIPLKGETRLQPLAVLFIDTSVRGTLQDDLVLEIASEAANGLTKYLERKYPR